MPPKQISDAELIALADLCDGNQSEMSRRLGGYSQSSISRRLRRLSWQPSSRSSRPAEQISDDDVIRRIQAQERLPDGFDIARREVLSKIAKTQADAALAAARAKVTDTAYHPWTETKEILRYVFQQMWHRMATTDALKEQAREVERVVVEHLKYEYPEAG